MASRCHQCHDDGCDDFDGGWEEEEEEVDAWEEGVEEEEEGEYEEHGHVLFPWHRHHLRLPLPAAP